MFEKHDSLFFLPPLSNIVVYRSSLALIKCNAAVFIFIRQAMSHDRLRRRRASKLSNVICSSCIEWKKKNLVLHKQHTVFVFFLDFEIGLVG